MLLINLKTEQRKGNYSLLSDRLMEEINLALQKKQKVLLFYNRKNYARRIICADCRYLLLCDECRLPLHSPAIDAHNLACNHCQKKITIQKCPICGGMKWKFLGCGLQKIKQELNKQTDNESQIAIADKLLVTGYWLLVTKYDLVLSTHLPLIDHFDSMSPSIALAAILNADTDFYLPDFTASMRVFNRITAFKKFCRELQIKQVIIQTYLINNEVIQTAVSANFERFAKSELTYRHKLNYPPFCQLIKLVHQNKNKNKCRFETQKLYDRLKKVSSISPPQPTFIPKMRGNYRYQIVIKIQNYNSKLKTILKSLPPAWIIDADPISLL